MLWAVHSGKAGRAEINGVSVSWRSLYRTSEDLLTSSVFERLAYLPIESFLSILGQTFQFDGFDFKQPHISDWQFWPRWTPDENIRQSYVEPDIFMQIGDHKSHTRQDIIIEVKPHATHTEQTLAQWRNQILTYRKEYGETENDLLYLALGGLGANASRTAQNLSQQLDSELRTQVRFCGASWRDLRRAVTQEMDQASLQSRLLEDVLLSLDLAGHRPLRLFHAIQSFPTPKRFVEAREKINNAFPRRAPIDDR